MEETIDYVEMIYIQNTRGSEYSIECTGRNQQTVKLNFQNVDGIDLDPKVPVEIKHSFLQMSEGENKIWNIRFTYPVTIRIKHTGKIIIEFI